MSKESQKRTEKQEIANLSLDDLEILNTIKLQPQSFIIEERRSKIQPKLLKFIVNEGEIINELEIDELCSVRINIPRHSIVVNAKKSITFHKWNTISITKSAKNNYTASSSISSSSLFRRT